MKNKGIYWNCKFMLLGAYNNLRNCFTFKKKIHQANLMYKNTRNIKVRTYYPENWQKNSYARNLEIIGDNLIKEHLILQK